MNINLKFKSFYIEPLNLVIQKVLFSDTLERYQFNFLTTNGVVSLPLKNIVYTVLKSPHVNKKSREQFQLSSYKRLLDIYSSSSKTIDALMKLELPSGVEVEIKV